MATKRPWCALQRGKDQSLEQISLLPDRKITMSKCLKCHQQLALFRRCCIWSRLITMVFKHWLLAIMRLALMLNCFREAVTRASSDGTCMMVNLNKYVFISSPNAWWMRFNHYFWSPYLESQQCTQGMGIRHDHFGWHSTVSMSRRHDSPVECQYMRKPCWYENRLADQRYRLQWTNYLYGCQVSAFALIHIEPKN